MIRILFALAFCFPLSASLLHADAELVHAPTYKVGQVIKSETAVKSSQTLTVAGMELVSGADNFTVSEQRVTEVSNGKSVLDGKLSQMQMDLTLPGGQSMNFDSGNPNAETPAGPYGEIYNFLKLLSQSKWTSIIDGEGQIEKLEYDADFLEKVPTAFKDQVSPDSILKESKTAINRLPGKKVAVGDKWTRNEEASLGSGQKFYTVREYTYLGPETHNGEKLEKIGIQTKSIEYDLAAGGLPVTLKESDLKVDSSSGELWYSPKVSQVVEINDTMHVTGTMTLVANGAELPSVLDLTLTVNSKTTTK